MSIEIKVPVLPESISEATIAAWHKKAGEPVKRDEQLVDIETDKVVLEVVAPADGALEDILKKAGDTVTAEEVIGVFKEGPLVTPVTNKPEEAQKTPTVSSKTAESTEKLSPAARRLAREQEGDATKMAGRNESGQITTEETVLPIMDERMEKRVPMSRLQARMAERLLQVTQSAAILTTFNEINMQPIIGLREKYQETFEKDYGVRLGFMSFFTIAVVEALKRFPIINAAVDGSDIIYYGYYDIGIAIASSRGLVVPIIRNVENLNMAQIEKKILDFKEKANNATLSMEELTGGTFTISNAGVFGSLMSTPILNPPQSAILGMHKIEARPIVENGAVVIRSMMYVALSYDHRIIGGADAVQFLVTVKELLEDPARLLLNV